MSKTKTTQQPLPTPADPVFVVDLYAFLLEKTETFSDMGTDLAYLFPEMLRGGRTQIKRGGPLGLLLEKSLPKDHLVWRYIEWLHD